MLWHLDTLLKEMLIGKINTSIWFHCMKKKNLMEDKRRRSATLVGNPKGISHW